MILPVIGLHSHTGKPHAWSFKTEISKDQTNIYQIIRKQRTLHNTLLWLYSLYHHAKVKLIFTMKWHISFTCYHARLEILHIQCHDAAQWSTWKLRVKQLSQPKHTLTSIFFISKNYFQPERFTTRKILQLLKSTYSDKTYGVLLQFLPPTNNINVDLLSLFKLLIWAYN